MHATDIRSECHQQALVILVLGVVTSVGCKWNQGLHLHMELISIADKDKDGSRAYIDTEYDSSAQLNAVRSPQETPATSFFRRLVSRQGEAILAYSNQRIGHMGVPALRFRSQSSSYITYWNFQLHAIA